jgi:uncharacterized protein (DUF433 family)
VLQVAVARDFEPTFNSGSASADRVAEGVPSALTNERSITLQHSIVNCQSSPRHGAQDLDRRALGEAFGSRLTRMGLLDRIGLDTSVRFGKPCVRGTRISVGDVLDYLAAGVSEDRLLLDFPQLVRDDIRACLAYAAERERGSLPISAAGLRR